MADELTINASLGYADADAADLFLEVVAKLATAATKKYTKAKQSIGLTEEALNLGEVTAPGWCVVVNRDVTNFVYVKNAAAGQRFAKLLAGECCLLRLGPDAQVPYLIADTAACVVEYLVAST